MVGCPRGLDWMYQIDRNPRRAQGRSSNEVECYHQDISVKRYEEPRRFGAGEADSGKLR